MGRVLERLRGPVTLHGLGDTEMALPSLDLLLSGSLPLPSFPFFRPSPPFSPARLPPPGVPYYGGGDGGNWDSRHKL